MTGPLRRYLLALQFFTRIPITGRLAEWVGFSPQMLQASLAHFPGVGWTVGLLVALPTALLEWLLSGQAMAPLVVAALGTAWGLLLTGAFHEDGLADVADGLGGSYDRLRALEIMKDSRVGAFGAIAVAMALICKVALVAQLAHWGTGSIVLGLTTAHVLSRSWPLLLVATLPNVSDLAGSKSKPMADRIGARGMAVALLWCGAWLALSVGLCVALDSVPDGMPGTDEAPQDWADLFALPELAALLQAWIGALVASALAAFALRRWFARRLGGYTGDCLGTTQQVTELACYLGWCLAWAGLS